jgi:hypothetical protein
MVTFACEKRNPLKLNLNFLNHLLEFLLNENVEILEIYCKKALKFRLFTTLKNLNCKTESFFLLFLLFEILKE